MKVDKYVELLDSDFFVGVPDSLLRPLCDYLMFVYGIDPMHHIIAANEGNCIGIAAGYYLSTGKVPVIYMQNSGEGNAINPIASLMNEKVYGIPAILIIGWRGKPGVHDEPQHIFQGEITLKLLEVLDIDYLIIDQSTTDLNIKAAMKEFRNKLSKGKMVAFVVEKDALSVDIISNYKNNYTLSREDAIKCIIDVVGNDAIVSTTGKASRELFEIREKKNQKHDCDFMTVGGMGHASSIALGVATNSTKSKVWCIDGDGATLMHMGAMAVIGATNPTNYIHILINNEAHESVGGFPTVSSRIDFCKVAEGCGYSQIESVDNAEDLRSALITAKIADKLTFIEIKCSIGSRKDLGRPTLSAEDNKYAFMRNLNK